MILDDVFESAQVVSLKPGDVIVFRCARKLTQQERQAVGQVLDETFPQNDSLIVMPGEDMAVLRRPSLWQRLFGRG